MWSEVLVWIESKEGVSLNGEKIERIEKSRSWEWYGCQDSVFLMIYTILLGTVGVLYIFIQACSGEDAMYMLVEKRARCSAGEMMKPKEGTCNVESNCCIHQCGC